MGKPCYAGHMPWDVQASNVYWELSGVNKEKRVTINATCQGCVPEKLDVAWYSMIKGVDGHVAT